MDTPAESVNDSITLHGDTPPQGNTTGRSDSIGKQRSFGRERRPISVIRSTSVLMLAKLPKLVFLCGIHHQGDRFTWDPRIFEAANPFASTSKAVRFNS